MKNDKKIRKKNLVALDIGTSSIKVAVGKYINKKLAIKKIAHIKTPEASVSNGRITDSGRLTETIKKVIKENKIKEKYAVVNIKSSSIINRELTIPFNEDPVALDRIVHYEMKQLAAIKYDLYVTQYQVIEEVFVEKMKFLKILVTSVEKEIVQDYLKLVKDIGLKPYVFDVHFNTIRKFFGVYDEGVHDGKTIAVIDIGYNNTDITVVIDGIFKMSRTIDYGSNMLESVFKNEFKMEFNEATVEEIFCSEDEVSSMRVGETLSPLIGEINDVLRYHISRDSKNTIDHIFLTGGLSGMTCIADYFHEAIGFEVYEFEVLDHILVGYDGKYDIPKYLNVLGALIRS